MPTEKDLEYGKRHGFDKLEERENAKLLAGIDTNASSTAKDGRTVKKKTKKHFDSDDEDSISSGSTSDSSEGSYVEVEVTGSDGSESGDYESSGEE